MKLSHSVFSHTPLPLISLGGRHTRGATHIMEWGEGRRRRNEEDSAVVAAEDSTVASYRLSRLVVNCHNRPSDNAPSTVMVEQQGPLPLPPPLPIPSPSSVSSASSGTLVDDRRLSPLWGNLTGSQCDDWYIYQVTSTATSKGARVANLQHRLAQPPPATPPSTPTLLSNSTTNTPRAGWSVAVWFTVLDDPRETHEQHNATTTAEEIPLVSLAQLHGRPLGDYLGTGCPGYDWEMSYSSGAGDRSGLENSSSSSTGGMPPHWIVRYRDSDALLQTCRTVRVPLPPKSHGLHHVVVSFATDTLQLFGDGHETVSTPLWPLFDITLSGWDPNNVLQILRSSPDDNGQAGATDSVGVHQVEFYAQALNSSDSKQLYGQGYIRTPSDKSPAVVLQPHHPLAVTVEQDAVRPVSFEVGGTALWNRDLSILSSGEVDEAGSEGLLLVQRVVSVPKYGRVAFVADHPTSIVSGSNDWEHWAPLALVNATNASTALLFTLQDHEFFTLPLLLNDSAVVEEAIHINASVVWNDQVLTSNVFSVPIQVQHVNRPPQLTSPTDLVPRESTIFIHNITLIDPDADTPVRVDVVPGSSQVTLTSQTRPPLETALCRQRTDSPWQCVGDGVADRMMTFVAPTGDVTAILENLKVDLLQVQDNVTVRVYDGVGGNCLSAREHALYGSSWTVHRDCYCAEATVQIRLDGAFLPRTSSQDTTNVSRIAKLLFWGLTLSVALGILACLRRCLIRFLARGHHRRGAIDADDGSASSSSQSDVGTVFTDAPNQKKSDRNASCMESDDDWGDDCASF